MTLEERTQEPMRREMFKALFERIYNAKNEQELDLIISELPDIFEAENWYPLGGNDNNFGVVENQQSNPVAAVVEKITNSIDAILMRKCYEAGIDPRSSTAPRSVEEAVERFFPHYKNWDLVDFRNQQAENIQILADSHPRDTSNTSLIIYDDGEGQHPEDFESTFLSLLRGNKNEVHFVQGKYNMGGSGAITFCGKRRYQLVASKRYDGTGDFGFTLIRKHPLTNEEVKTKKSTWYEYLKIDGKIPSFPINELDLNLLGRKFRTGTIIKLYSYDTKGNRHIRRDFGRSLNEFLYEPALPLYTIESAERYPNDHSLTGVVFGLKRQLGEDNNYIEETFSETYSDSEIGNMKVTVHVFKTRAKGKTPAETRKTIQNEYFKNNMAVLFSVNGQVHAHYTSEFITRSLRFNLLRDYLLIHVDCTDMKLTFRDELFMASRDRLKQGEEASTLRTVLRDNLRQGRLKEIYKRRKDNLSVESTDDGNLLKSFAENLPITNELRGLLSQTFKLDEVEREKKGKQTRHSSNGDRQNEEVEFNPKRFPSFFRLDSKQKGNRRVIKIPPGGTRTIQFNSDVENAYFDRSEEPGELRIAILDYVPNEATGGTKKGIPDEVSEIFSIIQKSPLDGTIKVVFKPTKEVCVGDEIQVKVDLTAPGEDFSEIFWVKITEPPPKQKAHIPKPEDDKIGLPQYILVYKDDPNQERRMTWEGLTDSGIPIDFNWDVVMYPQLEGDVLEKIYINMDSNVLKSYKSSIKGLSVEQLQLADRRYISSVYFHTLFLYVINKRRGYHIFREEKELDVPVDMGEYLMDIFTSHYAAFLMNFGMGELVEAFA